MVFLPDVLVGLTVVALEFLTGFATAPLDRVSRAMVYWFRCVVCLFVWCSVESQQEDRAVRTLGVADGVMGCCCGGVVNTDYLEV